MTKKILFSTVGVLICLNCNIYARSLPLENVVVVIDPGHSGIYNNSLSDKSGKQSNFGGGIGIKLFGHNLDYAVIPYAELGLTQRISYNANF